MTKPETEGYIRALFCDYQIDWNMTIDNNVLDAVYKRARGCPLFNERAIMWAQQKCIIELDETRNAVALNLPDGNSTKDHLIDILLAQLNKEILEVINYLPHEQFDALKIACCIGATFCP